MLALGLGLYVRGWSVGVRKQSRKQQTSPDRRAAEPRLWTIPKRRKEKSEFQGSLLLGDTGRETIREADLQRSQNKQDGTDVGIQLRGQNGLSSTTEGSLLPVCSLP